MPKRKLILGALILLSGCARRKSLLDDFQPKKSVLSTNRLTLPAVRWCRVQQKAEGLEVSWASCQSSQVPVGYAVYRWRSDLFIKKTPLNVCLPSEHLFIDTTADDSADFCYMVRAIFEHEGIRVEGPGSPVAQSQSCKK